MTQNAQAQNPALPLLVEEKFFPIDMERNYDLLKAAITDALDAELEELAHGMWVAKLDSNLWNELEVTVVATPADDGTLVKVSVQHHTTGTGIVAITVVLIPAILTVIPLIFLIAHGQRGARQRTRIRMIAMHKIWTELTRAVGAPKRSSFREPPRRIRSRVAEPEAREPEHVEDEADDSFFEEEAAP